MHSLECTTTNPRLYTERIPILNVQNYTPISTSHVLAIADASRRVPPEFILQRVDIANPPSLLLAIEKLNSELSNQSDVCSHEAAHTPHCDLVRA
jgi:hypothetical protein